MASGRVAILPGIKEKGSATTGADGSVSISFAKAYPTKPTPFLGGELPVETDTTFVQVNSWILDAEGRYIGMVVYAHNDAGKPVANVLVHWSIV